MKYTFFLMFVLAMSSACSRTTYSVSPSFGYDLPDSTKLIIAKFQNSPNDEASEALTTQLLNLYQACASVKVIPYDSVQNIFYRNVAYVDPIWKIDTKFLVDLYETTRARYLLVGKVLGESSDRPPVSIAKSYGNGQIEDIHENWTTLQFTLYDLATSQEALELHTRTKAGQYNHPQDDGGVMSFHAPVNLIGKAFEKSKDKLTEVCSCRK